jgi:predicted RNase H-like HicB family nuclease
VKKYYIAGIVPEKKESGGGFSVYLPDLPNVAAGGGTVEEAIGNATSGLYVALRGLAEQNNAIPKPSGLEEVRAKVREERETDGLPYPEDTIYQYIAPPVLDATPVRLNVSLARTLVDEVDTMRDRLGLTRSGLIAAATRDYLSRLPRP